MTWDFAIGWGGTLRLGDEMDAYTIALWTLAAIGALATARGIASAIEWARDKYRTFGG